MSNGPQEWPLLPQPAAGMPDHLPGVPAQPSVRRPPGLSADDPLKISASWSNELRSGRWVVPPFIVASPSMSNVKLDLRDAVPQSDLIHLTVDGVAGSIILVVPPGWAVDTDRLGKGLGTVRNRIGPLGLTGYPVVIVSGSMGLGTFVARGERFYERWGRGRRQAGQRELMR